MKHFVSSIQENKHGLLEHMFVDYANLLRSKYPYKTIRNAAVFASGVPEFARFGYIELIDARKAKPDGRGPQGPWRIYRWPPPQASGRFRCSTQRYGQDAIR